MKTKFAAVVSRWGRDVQANVTVPSAIVGLALILIVGMATDMRGVESQKQTLQRTADNAAIFAARELVIANRDETRIKEVAISYIAGVDRDISAGVTVDVRAQTVTVSATRTPMTYFPTPLTDVKALRAEATAELAGQGGNVCLIALGTSERRTIQLNQKARLTADSCIVYANSTNAQAVKVNATATIDVDQVILSGGYQGNIRSMSSLPVTDAPPIDDPLARRPRPRVRLCDHHDFVLESAEMLEPGVYCGGLRVTGGSASLKRGIYIIKDGPLSVTNGGSLVGDNVGFYLTGTNAKLDFATLSTISLSGPLSGELAGLLFFANPDNPLASKANPGTGLKGGHVIRSDNARRLVGTIYLPDDKLVIDGEEPVADASEYTVIIAKAFELNNGPNLVIRTDYNASNVPVPQGVGPVTKNSVRIVN